MVALGLCACGPKDPWKLKTDAELVRPRARITQRVNQGDIVRVVDDRHVRFERRGQVYANQCLVEQKRFVFSVTGYVSCDALVRVSRPTGAYLENTGRYWAYWLGVMRFQPLVVFVFAPLLAGVFFGLFYRRISVGVLSWLAYGVAVQFVYLPEHQGIVSVGAATHIFVLLPWTGVLVKCGIWAYAVATEDPIQRELRKATRAGRPVVPEAVTMPKAVKWYVPAWWLRYKRRRQDEVTAYSRSKEQMVREATERARSRR